MGRLRRSWRWLTGQPPIKADYLQERAVIRYDEIYIHVLEGENGWDIGWDYQPPSHYPVREIIEVEDTDNE